MTHVTERRAPPVPPDAPERPPAMDGRQPAGPDAQAPVRTPTPGSSIHAGDRAVELLKTKVAQNPAGRR